MKRLFGGVLLSVGILIAGASGLCSLAGLINVIVEMIYYPAPGAFLGAVLSILLIAGIPFAIGIGLIIAGRRTIRSAGDDAW